MFTSGRHVFHETHRGENSKAFSSISVNNDLSHQATVVFCFIEGRRQSIYRFFISPLTRKLNVQLVTVCNLWDPDSYVNILHVTDIQAHSRRDLYSNMQHFVFIKSDLSCWVCNDTLFKKSYTKHKLNFPSEKRFDISKSLKWLFWKSEIKTAAFLLVIIKIVRFVHEII